VNRGPTPRGDDKVKRQQGGLDSASLMLERNAHHSLAAHEVVLLLVFPEGLEPKLAVAACVARLQIERQGRGVGAGDARIDNVRPILVLVARNGVQVFGMAGEDADLACTADSFAA